MEITGSDFSKICGCTPQNIYMQVAQGNLIKTESGKYNIHEPLNKKFLTSHGGSVKDVEKYINSKPKPHVRQPIGVKKTAETVNNGAESVKLIKCVSNVIEKEFGVDKAKKIKYLIMMEYKNG